MSESRKSLGLDEHTKIRFDNFLDYLLKKDGLKCSANIGIGVLLNTYRLHHRLRKKDVNF